MRVAVATHAYPLDMRDEQGVRSVVMHQQTASFGVAQLEPDMDQARLLLGAADLMLYTAKRAGRNCVRS